MQKPWSEQLVIRHLVETDLPFVAKIEKQELSPWSEAAIAGELQQENSLQLVVCDVYVVLGWCCCRFTGREAELLKIVVSQPSRCLGIATRLLGCVESQLLSVGVRTLFLEVRAHNRSAVSFYLGAGFTEVGRRITYYRQPVDDALVLRKFIQ